MARADGAEIQAFIFNWRGCEENALALVSFTEIAADCPLMRVNAAGAAVRVKFEEAATVRTVPDVPLSPFAVTVIGPVVAPAGITNVSTVFVKLDSGADKVPPPC